MIKALKIFSVVFLLGMVFVAGAGTAIVRSWGDRSVRAELVNNSDQRIRSFILRYKTCGTKAEITGGELLPGKARTVRFQVCGKADYIVEVTLENGSVVSATEGYVQSGYAITHTVTTTGIVSADHAYAL